NGDGEARLLHQPGGRQAEGASADHGDGAGVTLEPELGGEFGAPPTQGDPAAAMAVIVNQRLVAELFAANDEARPAVGTQTRNSSDDAALVDQYFWEWGAAAEGPRPADR